MDISELLSKMSPEELQQFAQMGSLGDTRDQMQQMSQTLANNQGTHHSFLGGFLGGFSPGMAGAGATAQGNKQSQGRLAYMQALQRLIAQKQPDFFEGGGMGLNSGAAFD